MFGLHTTRAASNSEAYPEFARDLALEDVAVDVVLNQLVGKVGDFEHGRVLPAAVYSCPGGEVDRCIGIGIATVKNDIRPIGASDIANRHIAHIAPIVEVHAGVETMRGRMIDFVYAESCRHGFRLPGIIGKDIDSAAEAGIDTYLYPLVSALAPLAAVLLDEKGRQADAGAEDIIIN